MVERKKRTTAGDKTICLPIADGIDYEQLVKDTPPAFEPIRIAPIQYSI
jgi:hypothetical protein